MSTDYNRDHLNDVDMIIERQTHQERNFLVPVRDQAEIVLYDVVLKALQTGQIITGLMTTMTKLSVGLTDTSGERAEYTQQAHGLLARHRNTSLGRHDTFWSCGSPDETLLLDPLDAVNAYAEMICGPVEEGLVQEVRHWAGAKLLPEHWYQSLRLEPLVQSKRATYKKVIRFMPVPPKILTDHFDPEKARELVEQAIDLRTEYLNDTRLQRLGRSTVIGRAGCKRINPFTRGAELRSPARPHVRGTTEQVEEAMEELREKRAFYQQCRELFVGDHKDVVFAAGTVMMRKLGAYCDPLPPTGVLIPPACFPRPPNTPAT